MNAAKPQNISEVFLLCEAKETGTIFITNNVNHSCQIVLKEGEIFSMAFGQLKGDEVLTSLQLMKIVRISFRKDLVLPMQADAEVSSSQEALQALAYRKPESIDSPQSAPTTNVNTSKPVRMYRGQVVRDTSPVAAGEPVPTPKVKSNKPLRMYRGQVVHG